MADPSRAQIQSAWSDRIRLLNQTRLYGNINATNFLALLDTAGQSFRGDYQDDDADALQALRSNLSATVNDSAARNVQHPWLRQYCKSVIGLLDVDNASDDQLWDELYRYMIDNNLFVDSRRMTFGASTAGAGNVGNPQVVRLTVDRYNFNIESGHGDTKRLLCVADQNVGTGQGNEQWQIIGQAKARDDLQRSGSGIEGLILGSSLDDSLLLNPGFRQFGGDAATPTSLTNWTSSVPVNGTNYDLDSTNTFRTAPSEENGTVYALSLNVTATLSQRLIVGGLELDDTVPYLLATIWNRAIGAASGTLSVRLGTVTTTVTVAAQAGWNVTTVPNPMGQAAWYRNFAQANAQIQLEWTRTGGDLLIAEVLLLPGQRFDGLWYWVIPASVASWTAPRVRDTFTFADGESSTGGVNQRWFARAYGRYAPHRNGSSITWADA